MYHHNHDHHDYDQATITGILMVHQDTKSDPELSQRLAAFLAHHPEIIKVVMMMMVIKRRMMKMVIMMVMVTPCIPY